MLPVKVRRENWMPSVNRLEQEFDRWMNRFWPESWDERDMSATYPVDIYEEEDRIVVDAELPGFRPEEVDVSIENGMLTITAERKPQESKGTRHLSERRFTRVERSFTLPRSVDPEKVEARLEGGVLHLEMPETEESKPHKIPIS